MKIQRSTKGFTLVEIMIVVVIIGLLAAMAIPAFQKVRTDSIAKAMVNDARQIGAAMQQIQTEYAGIKDAETMAFNIDTLTGAVTSTGKTYTGGAVIADNELTKYVNRVSRGYKTAAVTYTFQVDDTTKTAFNLDHNQVSPVDVIKNSAKNTSTSKGVAVAFLGDGKAAP